ncbi:MAG: response regulator [Rhodobacteraceae bacterium]|nr:response regulator [Paracoccaceae bacterium]
MNSYDKSSSTHLLIVDDDQEIRVLLNRFLSKQGFRVSTAADNDEMLAILEKWKIDLVVLDRMLPGKDGLSICQDLRSISKVPVVMLTVLGEENDRIEGFKVGVDDYIAKPFNPHELLARVKAVLRRTNMAPPTSADSFGHMLEFGNWHLDISLRQLTARNGTLVDLSATEFDLLTTFVERPGIVLSRDQLLDLAGGQVEMPFDRKIDMQVSRLRRKIEDDPKNPTLIQTVRGGGYRFAAEVSTIEKPSA